MINKLIAIIEKWHYGGQNRSFFDNHEEEIREHNIKLTKALIIVLMAIDGIYAATGMNCQGSPYIRWAYILFFVLLAVLLLLFKPLFGRAKNGYLCIISIIELAFLFLIFAEPVLDTEPIACFVPAFFALAFVLPVVPIYWMTEIYVVDLSIFCAVTFLCKDLDTAVIDILDACTFFVLGVMLGGFILKGRCSEILSRDVIKETSDAEVARAMNIANKDALTGVQSRTAYSNMELILNSQIEAGTNEDFGIIVCDCNNLKEINDTYGHSAGDRLIVDVSGKICEIFLHSPVYRTGGDEFAVLLQGADFDNRVALIKKLDKYTDENYSGYSLAWGMSEFDKEKDVDVHDVYKRADDRMYENKREIKKLQEHKA